MQPEGVEVRAAQGRARAAGKFLRRGAAKLLVRGVTYGTFAPDAQGHRYPARDRVESDFAAIAAFGANALRVYTTPPRWLLDTAEHHGLQVMVGVSWEEHVAFLDRRESTRRIVDSVRAQVASIAGHPAVLCLAVGNEVPAPIVRWHGARRVERFIERLYRAAKAEDTFAAVTYVNYPSTEYLELPFLDIVSFNVFLESVDTFEAYVSRLHNLAGDRPLLITEIGLDSGQHGERAQARLVAAEVRASIAGGCAGAFVFSWTDEWHRGEVDVSDWAFGLTDAHRRPRESLWAVRRAFRDGIPHPHGDEPPRVSVVVCSRNGERTIGECLEGIMALDYPDVETIVVDDGSTDSTAEIAARHDVLLIRTGHGGLSAARNAGLAAATGEIVAFTDDDAVPDEDWLRHLVGHLLDDDHVAVGGPNIAPEATGRVAAAVARAPGGPTHVLLSDRMAEHIPGCNMAFWKGALEMVGGFDARFRIAGDDVDICWRLQDRSGTIGFSPGAMVWHRRRPSMRAYLRQQREYGRAEALLERKWPDKYNRGGHLAWAGRVYAAPSQRAGMGSRRRIHYGSWGENLFQSVYDHRPSTPRLLPLMPEWYLLIAVFVALTGYDALHGALLFRVPGLRLSASPFLLGAAVCALLVQAFRAGWSATRDQAFPRRSRFARAALTAALFVAQPLARLSGRIGNGLTPWRRRGALRIGRPWPRRVVVWSESWRSARDRLLAIEAHLRPNCMSVVRGGEYDRWDMRVRLGPLAAAQMSMTLEEHGSGRQLVRFRISPRWSFGFVGLGAVLVAAAVAKQVAGDSLSAVILAGLALVLGVRALQECGASIAAIVAAVDAGSALSVTGDVSALFGAIDWTRTKNGDGAPREDVLDLYGIGRGLLLEEAGVDG